MTPNPKSEPFCQRCRWLIGIHVDETRRLWPDLCVLKIPLVVYRPLGPTANKKKNNIDVSVKFFARNYLYIRIIISFLLEPEWLYIYI